MGMKRNLDSVQSRRHPKQVLTDLDFADDISLLSDEIVQAQDLLLRVERECKKVGLGLNAKKTKGLPLNVDSPPPLHTADGTEIEWVDDFKYLGSWVESTEKDISVRRALAWQALNKMTSICSNLINALRPQYTTSRFNC